MSHVEIERRVSKAAYSGKERRLPPKPAVEAKWSGLERRMKVGVSPTGKERRVAKAAAPPVPAGLHSQAVYSGPERRRAAGVGPNGVERRKVL